MALALVKEQILNLALRREYQLQEAEAAKKRREEWKQQCELTKIDWLERLADLKLKNEKKGIIKTADRGEETLKNLFAERKELMQKRSKLELQERY